MADLLNVDLAIEQILNTIEPMPSEIVTLLDAFGRVLAQDIISEINLPSYPNSSMDGYAVRAEDTQNAPVRLNVVMDIPAGAVAQRAITNGEAARIMTGAPMPDGADAIVPVEDTDSIWDQKGDSPLPPHVTINKSVKPGASVRMIGENVKLGQAVLKAGTVLRPQDIGILASMGVAHVAVTRQPKVLLLTSGDELIGFGEPLTTGKIYDTNSFALAGLVKQEGAIPLILPPAPDRIEAVRALFNEALAAEPDMIISSAGVSVGTADFVRTILEELGQVNFWRINIRPGKPLAFGHLRAKNGQLVPFFGLPGNPVSAMVTYDVVTRPALFKMLGRTFDPASVTAVTAEDMTSDGRRSYMRVKLAHEDNKLTARLTGNQSSNALMSMVLADGLMIIPEGVTFVPAGTALTVRLLRPQ